MSEGGSAYSQDPYYYQNPMYSTESARPMSGGSSAYAQGWFWDNRNNRSGYHCDDNGYCMYGDEPGTPAPTYMSGATYGTTQGSSRMHGAEYSPYYPSDTRMRAQAPSYHYEMGSQANAQATPAK